MATVSDVLNIAFARDKRAQRNKSATDEELFRVLSEVMGRYFAEGQRVNLNWFIEEEPVPHEDTVDGWSRPENAESVRRIELPSGEPVSVVPFDNKGVEPYKPAIYRVGRTYKRVPDANIKGRKVKTNPVPPNATLTFYYSRVPNRNRVTALATQLDEMWPDGHETLLGVELALYMARKDNREEGQAALEAQRVEQATRFFKFLEHEDRTGVRPTEREDKWSVPVAMPQTGGSS